MYEHVSSHHGSPLTARYQRGYGGSQTFISQYIQTHGLVANCDVIYYSAACDETSDVIGDYVTSRGLDDGCDVTDFREENAVAVVPDGE